VGIKQGEQAQVHFVLKRDANRFNNLPMKIVAMRKLGCQATIILCFAIEEFLS
jgi:hypothetical protein